MKRMLIHNTSGTYRVDNRVRLSGRKKAMLVLGFLLTGVLSSLSDFHLERLLGMEYSYFLDILQHGGYYFLFTLFLIWILPHERKSVSFFLMIFTISVFFEFLQFFIPGRTFTGLDIFSNFMGISTAFVLFNQVYRDKKNTWTRHRR
ncbi:MAG: VanZ family protein [Chitinophagales bacterium]|nr:VanZ family protein [Chitinophagales bacterium]